MENISILLAQETTTTDVTTTAIEEASKAPFSWSEVWTEVVKWATTTGIKILIALFILIISFKVINVVCKKITKRLNRCRIIFSITRNIIKFCRRCNYCYYETI